jgi:transcriptional regulator with XRE-family HTH domain
MSNRIRELRGEMTLLDLARLLGTTPGQISRLESGSRKLNQKWLDRLADALGVQPSDILPSSEPLPATKAPPLEVQLRLMNAKLDRQTELLEAIAGKLKRRA